MNKDNNHIPLLRGTLGGSGQLNVWCPYCDAWHPHTWGSEAPRKRHHIRDAHCINPDSPLHLTGYYVAPWKVSDLHSFAVAIANYIND